ncbi:MAG TPA: HAD family phosphatase [Patescibacteria group bacterium]|nr:HAD family phosphatase [Patescibacteria group bacterium]
MLKAVIFDMDGVLVDTEPLADLHFSRFLKDQFNIKVDPEFFQRFRGSTSKHFWEIIIKEFNLESTYEEISEIARPRYLEFLKKSDLQAIPGIKVLIENLLKANIKIAVASSASHKRIKTILEIIKLDDKFEIIISADHIKNSKPHPEIYLIAAKTLGVDPKDCIAIEDATNGV